MILTDLDLLENLLADARYEATVYGLSGSHQRRLDDPAATIRAIRKERERRGTDVSGNTK